MNTFVPLAYLHSASEFQGFFAVSLSGAAVTECPSLFRDFCGKVAMTGDTVKETHFHFYVKIKIK
jgi:hypothetical protein